MRRLVPLVCVLVCGASAAACGGRGTEATSKTTVTSSTHGRERTIADKIATALCVHEAECGHTDPVGCIDMAESRSNRELASWTCEPAEAQAAAEQCLTAIRAEPCTSDLMTRKTLCTTNGGCANVEPMVPGPEAYQ